MGLTSRPPSDDRIAPADLAHTAPLPPGERACLASAPIWRHAEPACRAINRRQFYPVLAELARAGLSPQNPSVITAVHPDKGAMRK